VRERASEGESEIGRREKRESARSRERECVRERGERESEGEPWSEQHLTIPHAHQRLCRVMSPRHLLSEGGTRGEGKWDGCVWGGSTPWKLAHLRRLVHWRTLSSHQSKRSLKSPACMTSDDPLYALQRLLSGISFTFDPAQNWQTMPVNSRSPAKTAWRIRQIASGPSRQD
jgi:hypothetical protein